MLSSVLRKLLQEADIEIHGGRRWDIQVHDERFFGRVVRGGSLALGEAYMDGWWDAEALDEFFFRVLRSRIDQHFKTNFATALLAVRNKIRNQQRVSKAFHVGRAHYDIGNDIYQAMLDERMVYTCGYWKDATTLGQAQEAKLDLVCRKIGLEKGMRVLDIGGGWGSFAKFAAQKYGVSVVATTVSKKQKELGEKLCVGLPVEIRLEDYRVTSGTYDRIVSLGMFEHVGYKNYRTFMEAVHQLLADDGAFLLHSIGGDASVTSGDQWMNKYIFPRGMLPSISQIGSSIEHLFVMEDWHNFGADYDKTLMAWFQHFDAAWHTLEHTYGKRLYRMWKYYLLSCAGLFRARRSQLWQIVLSKGGILDGYTSIR